MIDMAKADNEFTTVSLRRGTVERLEDIRPYESISWDEFIGELADAYEREN